MEVLMPPRGVKNKKRARQYYHIKASELRQGRSPKVAKRIAAATVNKTRREKGEVKGNPKAINIYKRIKFPTAPSLKRK